MSIFEEIEKETNLDLSDVEKLNYLIIKNKESRKLSKKLHHQE